MSDPLDVLGRIPGGGFVWRKWYNKINAMQYRGMTDKEIIDIIGPQIERERREEEAFRAKQENPFVWHEVKS